MSAGCFTEAWHEVHRAFGLQAAAGGELKGPFWVENLYGFLGQQAVCWRGFSIAAARVKADPEDEKAQLFWCL